MEQILSAQIVSHSHVACIIRCVPDRPVLSICAQRSLRDKSGSCFLCVTMLFPSVTPGSLPNPLRAAFTPSLGGTLLVLASSPCEWHIERGQWLEVNPRLRRVSWRTAACGSFGACSRAFDPAARSRGNAQDIQSSSDDRFGLSDAC